LTAKEFLDYVKSTRALLESLQIEKGKILEDAARLKPIDYSKDRIDSSNVYDLSDTLAAIESKIDKINNKIIYVLDRLETVRMVADIWIGELNNGHIEAVLRDRLFNNLTVEEIAEVHHWSVRQVYMLQEKGLNQISANHPEGYDLPKFKMPE